MRITGNIAAVTHGYSRSVVHVGGTFATILNCMSTPECTDVFSAIKYLIKKVGYGVLYVFELVQLVIALVVGSKNSNTGRTK